MQKFLKRNWFNIFFVLVLVVVSFFISFKNFTPNTWLLGWDNLVPELNFKLNLVRSVSSVWQEYQGVGLLGGMAHAADLIRVLILKGFSYFIPLMYLRYLWTFLMLVLGPVGVYYLVKRFVGDSKNGFLGSIAAFSSAIFYIFNLATVQTFFTPFETFTSFYGFFPWLLFFATKYLKEGEKTNLFWFGVISLLGTTAFYVQTLFVVYAIFLFVFALEAIIRRRGEGVKRSLLLALVTIFINAFWLLPASYYAITNSNMVGSSHINSIATPETKIMNQARSNIADVASLKGYWFDYYDWDSSGNYGLLYKDWINYEANPWVGKISLILFVVSILGLILIFVRPKKTFGSSTIVLLGVCLFMILGGNLSKIPILDEAFRNVFTKWSVATALVYAIGLGFIVYVLPSFIKNWIKYIPGVLISTIIVSGSVFTTLPILQGKLIASSMKVALPSYYFDTISYFKGIESDKRITTFPLTDFWGWQFNSWGYRGSGFIWYGIPQPILSRTFDVWSPFNEQFYIEVNYALNWGSEDDLKRILEKYQVSYVLFDDSVVEMGNPNSSENIKKEKETLEASDFISKEKEFGKITVYKVDIAQTDKFISAPEFDYSDPLFKVWNTGNMVITEDFSDTQGYQAARNCNLEEKGTVTKEKRSGGNFYKAENDGVSCDYFYYPMLDYSKAYGLHIVGKNIEGRSLRFYLYNIKDEKVIMDELLSTGDFDETFVILPTGTKDDQGGYTLNVETRSFGSVRSENEITKVEIYELSFEKAVSLPIVNDLQVKDVKKYGTWGYRVEASGSGLIALGQGYEKGWIAFETKDIFRFKTLKHIKVNSWANGWFIPGSGTYYILFWPQVLEWGGMMLGLTTLLIMVLKRHSTP